MLVAEKSATTFGDLPDWLGMAALNPAHVKPSPIVLYYVAVCSYVYEILLGSKDRFCLINSTW